MLVLRAGGSVGCGVKCNQFSGNVLITGGWLEGRSWQFVDDIAVWEGEGGRGEVLNITINININSVFLHCIDILPKIASLLSQRNVLIGRVMRQWKERERVNHLMHSATILFSLRKKIFFTFVREFWSCINIIHHFRLLVSDTPLLWLFRWWWWIFQKRWGCIWNI